MHRLFGILYLDDKRTDIDKKGNHLKKYKSFFNSTDLLIKTKKTEMQRTYCIINYNDMSVNNYIKQDYIDDELFKYMSTCNWSFKLQNLKEEQLKSYLIDNTSNRYNYNITDIITVDPDNCIDIDDAISYKIINYNKSNYIELGIHIADPSSYINFDTELGRELINRCESIYLDKTYHMIPEILGIEHISLIEQKISRAFSLIIQFECDDINNIGLCIKQHKYTYKFIKTNITITKNLSYNQFEKDILHNEYYKNLYEIGKQILYGLNNDNDYYDSHKMIEGYMLFCNHLASKHTPIKRINNVKKINNNIKNKFYDVCLQGAAKYSLDDKIHEGLGISYTHFTSPMRRYIDFLNHIIIYNNFNNCDNKIIISQITQQQLEHINLIHTYYKKIYNIRNIHNLLGENDVINKKGQIIFIENNNLRVLIDKNLIININIFNNKFIDSKLNNNIIQIKEQNEKTIIFSYKEKEIKFELFQYINIQLYRTKLEINPFKIIIDDINEILFS
jgi:exoribonuclease R